MQMEKEKVKTEDRRRGACLGLTGACCRRGAGMRLGSPPPNSSLSRDVPWFPKSCALSGVLEPSEGRVSAQPPIGRLS